MRTWPVMNTIGTESIIASTIGVTRFVAPGPRGAERDADLAGRLRVALGGVAAAGLVADEHVADAGVEERVVRRQVRAAGKAEYDLDALRLQALHQGVDCTHVRRLLPGRGLGYASSRPGRVGSAVYHRNRVATTVRRAATGAPAQYLRRVVELGAAAGAKRVVEHADAPAARAPAARLVGSER